MVGAPRRQRKYQIFFENLRKIAKFKKKFKKLTKFLWIFVKTNQNSIIIRGSRSSRLPKCYVFLNFSYCYLYFLQNERPATRSPVAKSVSTTITTTITTTTQSPRQSRNQRIPRVCLSCIALSMFGCAKSGATSQGKQSNRKRNLQRKTRQSRLQYLMLAHPIGAQWTELRERNLMPQLRVIGCTALVVTPY